MAGRRRRLVSTVVIWFLFIPPYLGTAWGAHEVLQLSIFAIVSAANVLLVVLLNAMVDRLIVQQRNIRLLLDAAPSGFLLVDPAGTIKLANESMGKVFGYAPQELVGKKVELLVPEDQAEAHVAKRAAYMERPEPRPMAGRELSGRRKDGSPVPVEIGLNPVAQDGHSAVLATVVDISARKQADLARRLLVDELEHRTRNFFNVVEALVLTSAKGVESVPEFAQLLVGRVNAVSQAYALVGPTGRNVSLLGIMRSRIAAHAGRIAVDVEDIEIAPSMAQTFALVLHELATNSLKYDALSAPNGRVVVRGAFDPASREALYVFTWREHDGPPVAEPTRSGFGTVLLTKLAAQFAEQVDLQYAPDGLLYRLHISRARIESEPQAAAA